MSDEQVHLDSMESDGNPAVQRMRMARRVTNALLPQQDDTVIEAVRSADVLGSPDDVGVNGDFNVTALDLRLRILMMVGHGEGNLADGAWFLRAQQLLWNNPDTIACILVADDEQLSCRIIEFGEHVTPTSTLSSVPRIVSRRGKLRDTLHSYLRTIDQPWDVPPETGSMMEMDFDLIVDELSRFELESRKAKPARIPELKAARASLGGEDIAWIADHTLSLLRGESLIVDLEAIEEGGYS